MNSSGYEDSYDRMKRAKSEILKMLVSATVRMLCFIAMLLLSILFMYWCLKECPVWFRYAVTAWLMYHCAWIFLSNAFMDECGKKIGSIKNMIAEFKGEDADDDDESD
jgi:hypothetical protein